MLQFWVPLSTRQDSYTLILSRANLSTKISFNSLLFLRSLEMFKNTYVGVFQFSCLLLSVRRYQLKMRPSGAALSLHSYRLLFFSPWIQEWHNIILPTLLSPVCQKRGRTSWLQRLLPTGNFLFLCEVNWLSRSCHLKDSVFKFLPSEHSMSVRQENVEAVLPIFVNFSDGLALLIAHNDLNFMMHC